MGLYCVDLSIAADEPMAGSTTECAGIIFLTLDKRHWGVSPLRSPRLPPIFARLRERLAREQNLDVKFIHKRRADGRIFDAIITPELKMIQGVPAAALESVLLLARTEENTDFQATPLSGHHLFVCTHGQRERCCARYGYPVYRQLRRIAAADDAGNPRVWEASHLGGDRFAASALTFPTGNAYGRLHVIPMAAFWDCMNKGSIYGPAYRGNIFLEPVQQVMIAYLHGTCAAITASISVSLRDMETHRRTAHAHAEIITDSGDTQTVVTGIVRAELRPYEVHFDCRRLCSGHSAGRTSRWTAVAFEPD